MGNVVFGKLSDVVVSYYFLEVSICELQLPKTHFPLFLKRKIALEIQRMFN